MLICFIFAKNAMFQFRSHPTISWGQGQGDPNPSHKDPVIFSSVSLDGETK